MNNRVQSLPQTSRIKILGVLIDEKLSIADHVNSVCTKVSRSAGVMRKIKTSYLENHENVNFLAFFTPMLYMPSKFGVPQILLS